jgi:hypothetical protein
MLTEETKFLQAILYVLFFRNKVGNEIVSFNINFVKAYFRCLP